MTKYTDAIFVLSLIIFCPVYTWLHIEEGLPTAFVQSVGAFVVFFVCVYALLAVLNAALSTILGVKFPPAKQSRRSI